MAKTTRNPPPPGMKLSRLNLCGAGARPVWLRNSISDVILKGEVDHFRNGMAGITFSCAFSNMWKDPNNSHRIQHAVKFADVIKTRAYVVTGECDGILTVVAYSHNHGNLVDMNDERLTASIIQNHPEQLEQEFVFRAPPKVKRSLKPPVKRINVGVRKAFSPRGATARAVKAGLMSLQEAEEHARKQQDQYEYKRTMSAINETSKKK